MIMHGHFSKASILLRSSPLIIHVSVGLERLQVFQFSSSSNGIILPDGIRVWHDFSSKHYHSVAPPTFRPVQSNQTKVIPPLHNLPINLSVQRISTISYHNFSLTFVLCNQILCFDFQLSPVVLLFQLRNAFSFISLQHEEISSEIADSSSSHFDFTAPTMQILPYYVLSIDIKQSWRLKRNFGRFETAKHGAV